MEKMSNKDLLKTSVIVTCGFYIGKNLAGFANGLITGTIEYTMLVFADKGSEFAKQFCEDYHIHGHGKTIQAKSKKGFQY